MRLIQCCLTILLTGMVMGCRADDGPATEADRIGVGAECGADDDCALPENDPDPVQLCLTQFKGGYCGIEGCTADAACPEGAVCVTHSDGVNYCFRRCLDKSECNMNRSVENESNCSANIDFVEASTTGKACVPPSGG